VEEGIVKKAKRITKLVDEDDGIITKRISTLPGKHQEQEIMTSEKHRGREGILYCAEAYIDLLVEKLISEDAFFKKANTSRGRTAGQSLMSVPKPFDLG
jgi:hypothetical protein